MALGGNDLVVLKYFKPWTLSIQTPACPCMCKYVLFLNLLAKWYCFADKPNSVSLTYVKLVK